MRKLFAIPLAVAVALAFTPGAFAQKTEKEKAAKSETKKKGEKSSKKSAEKEKTTKTKKKKEG